MAANGHEEDLNKSPQSHLSPISHQLMYPERFSECYKEGKLKIIGKEKSAPLHTFHVPQNSVLSRIKDFLPQMSQANKNTALEIASNPDHKETLTVEPFAAESDESDDDTGDSVEEELKEKTHRTKEKLLQEEENFVEMNVALVPPEVLANFDDGDEDDTSSSDDESAPAVDVNGTTSMLSRKQPQNRTVTEPFHIESKKSPLISCIEESNPSDMHVNDGASNG